MSKFGKCGWVDRNLKKKERNRPKDPEKIPDNQPENLLMNIGRKELQVLILSFEFWSAPSVDQNMR